MQRAKDLQRPLRMIRRERQFPQQKIRKMRRLFQLAHGKQPLQVAAQGEVTGLAWAVAFAEDGAQVVVLDQACGQT